MTSKIDMYTPPPLPIASTVATPRNANAETRIGAVDASGAIGIARDSVKINASARSRNEVPFDDAKVQSLRAAVLGGTYAVDAGKIATHLINIDKQLP